MRKAYSYIRFSSKRQEAGGSILRQETKCREYCERMKFALSPLTPDKGVSGFRGANVSKGNLGKFLSMLKAGIVKPGEILVVEDLDRLTRQEPLDALDLFREILAGGVEIHAIEPKAEIYTRASLKDMGNLVTVIVLLSRAHKESERKSELSNNDFHTKLAEARKTKYPNHGHPPGWIDLISEKKMISGKLRMINAKYELNHHAETVKQIVQWGIDGLGPVAIAKRLNKGRVPTMSRKKCERWEFSAIQSIFTSKRVIGEYQPTIKENGKRIPYGDPLPGFYPAVISQKEYYKLQGVVATRKKTRAGRQSKNISNLFGKLLVSGSDGGTMVLSAKRSGKLNMVSANAVRGLAPHNSFDYMAFEAAFLKWVSEVELQESASESTDVREEQGEIQEIDKRLATLVDFFSDTKATNDSSVKVPVGNSQLVILRNLETRKAFLESEIERKKTLKAGTTPDTRHIAKLLEDPSQDKQTLRSKLRMAIANVVKVIYVWIEGTNIKRECFVKVRLNDDKERTFYVRFERNKEPITFSDGKKNKPIFAVPDEWLIGKGPFFRIPLLQEDDPNRKSIRYSEKTIAANQDAALAKMKRRKAK